jgi:hypothetical protein
MYENEKKIQIISAGLDKIPGPGGAWSATTVGTNGGDDVSNFSPSNHAAGPQ